MYKTILVPIDVGATDDVEASLNVAKDLAKASGGKIVLLNVLAPVPGFVALYLPEDAHGQAKSHAVQALKDIAAKHGIADTAELVVQEGLPYRTIIDFANEKGVDTIVISSHDPGETDFLLGSVAARVVRHAHCSVFVIRKPAG